MFAVLVLQQHEAGVHLVREHSALPVGSRTSLKHAVQEKGWLWNSESADAPEILKTTTFLRNSDARTARKLVVTGSVDYAAKIWNKEQQLCVRSLLQS